MRDSNGYFPGSLARLGRKGIEGLQPGLEVWHHDYEFMGPLFCRCDQVTLVGRVEDFDSRLPWIAVLCPEDLLQDRECQEKRRERFPTLHYEINLPEVKIVESKFIFLSEEEMQAARRQEAEDKIESHRRDIAHYSEKLKKLGQGE